MVRFQPNTVRLEPVTRTVFVKVRRQGSGQPCVSLASFASIPSGCLAPAGTRAKGSEADARMAIRAETGFIGQVACVGFGAGFYRCEYEWQKPERAVVVFKPAARVTML